MSLFSPQINLVLQIVIAVVLSAGVREGKRKRRFTRHGTLMIPVVGLNLLSFLLVMGPSLFGLQAFVVTHPLTALSIVTAIHGGFGAIATVLGIGLIVSWRLRSSRYCVGKKKIMQAATVFWLISLFSGFLVYSLLYIA